MSEPSPPKSQNPAGSGDRLERMVRGILIGGSLGAMAGLLEIMDLRRAIFLGALVGVLAAITRPGKKPKPPQS